METCYGGCAEPNIDDLDPTMSIGPIRNSIVVESDDYCKRGKSACFDDDIYKTSRGNF